MANEIDYPAKYALEDASGFLLLETGTDYLIKELQNYLELVRQDGAVGFWPLSEASAALPAADLAGSNNGTYLNTPTVGVTGPLVGETITATTFATGLSEEVQIAGSNSYSGQVTGSLTIEAWARFDVDGGGGDLVDFDAGLVWDITASVNVTGGRPILGVQFQGNNSVGGSLFLGGGSNLLNNGRYAVFGMWNHIAITIDGPGTTGTCWVNLSNAVDSGIGGPLPVQSMNGTPVAWSSGTLDIAGAGFAGGIALVAIYPTALTEDQLARHYGCGLQFLPDIPPPVMLAAH